MANPTELRVATTPDFPPEIVAISALPPIAERQARWFRRARRRARSIWVVIHCTDGHEGLRKAEDVAHMLATIPTRAAGGKPRSAHLIIDTNSVVQCVPFEREAFHAGSHANIHGEGIELCGRASQTRAQWLDALSLPMLSIAARVVRWRCDALGLPLELRDPAALRQLQPGITTHAALSKAFPNETKHTDPGVGFPMDAFLRAIRDA